MADLHEHLRGQKTYGHYLVDAEDNCRLFAFDIDTVPGPVRVGNDVVEPRTAWREQSEAGITLRIQLRCLAEGLAIRANRLLDVPVAVALSGMKGLHVYGFTGPVKAADARSAAVGILESFDVFDALKGKNFFRHRTGYEAMTIETYPKQGEVDEGGLGNLMKLPLGKHRVSGKTGIFLDCRAPYDTYRADNPFEVLNGRLPWDWA